MRSLIIASLDANDETLPDSASVEESLVMMMSLTPDYSSSTATFT